MSKSKKLEAQLAEVDHSIANYQKQLTILQVEIFKLELKKEKLIEQASFQLLKSQITKRAANQGQTINNQRTING